MLYVIWVILLVVCLILAAVTIFLVRNSYKKLTNYIESTGEIVSFHEGKSMSKGNFGKKMISPVVSYTVNGESYEFIGNYCSTAMKVGQEIKILHNKEKPSQATIKGGLYFAPIITGILTLLAAFALVVLLILRSKGIVCF